MADRTLVAPKSRYHEMAEEPDALAAHLRSRLSDPDKVARGVRWLGPHRAERVAAAAPGAGAKW
jgi:hypothetical protein